MPDTMTGVEHFILPHRCNYILHVIAFGKNGDIAMPTDDGVQINHSIKNEVLHAGSMCPLCSTCALEYLSGGRGVCSNCQEEFALE